MQSVDTPKREITIITRHAPYGKDNAFACVDMVLAFAVFEQAVNYLFLGDGVFQLLRDQEAKSIDQKTIAAALSAIELYGVKNIYVDSKSMTDRGVSAEGLILPVRLLDELQTAQLVATSHCVFNL